MISLNEVILRLDLNIWLDSGRIPGLEIGLWLVNILLNIVVCKNVSVETVLSQVPLNQSFRRILDGAKWDAWMHLCNRLMMIQLNGEADRFVWKLTTSGLLIVKLHHEDIMNCHNRFPIKYI
jgi:hypothetical protein